MRFLCVLWCCLSCLVLSLQGVIDTQPWVAVATTPRFPGAHRPLQRGSPRSPASGVRLHPETGAMSTRRCGKRYFLFTILIWQRSFCQDRLGTNIGKAFKKPTRFPIARAGCPAPPQVRKRAFLRYHSTMRFRLIIKVDPFSLEFRPILDLFVRI
eukprot:COSAG06_NODE_12414_length_1385_cov_1.090980_1_plen_155_part_00